MAYIDSTTLPQGFKFNNKETVDTIFSKVVIGNLFKDNTFIAGKTYTDKYEERAGQIYARRLGKISTTDTTASAQGALDLVETETADSLVLIQKLDVISVSEKCYDLVENLRSSGKSVDKVNEVVQSVKEKMQIKIMGYMLKDPVTSGGVLAGGAIRSATTTASSTATALITNILADRKQIKVNGGNADTLIISPEMEALLLATAGTSGNAFLPTTNEEWIRNGQIGRLFGMDVYTSNLLGGGTPTTLPVAGNALANSGTAVNTEYVIYDHDTLAVCGDILGVDLINAQGFFGSLARMQVLMGGGVTNPALAIAKVVAVDED